MAIKVPVSKYVGGEIGWIHNGYRSPYELTKKELKQAIYDLAADYMEELELIKFYTTSDADLVYERNLTTRSYLRNVKYLWSIYNAR